MNIEQKMADFPNHRYLPVTYFGVTILITWVSLFFAAYCSHTPGMEHYLVPAMIPSLLAPFFVALYIIYQSGNKKLKDDFKRRLFELKSIRPFFWLIIFLLMPLTVLLSTTLSLSFGQSSEQFYFSEGFSVLSGAAMISIAIMFLAPACEELGWRGYGVDSLLQGRSLLEASLLFALVWGLWHVPLFFIDGYYHYEILQINVLYGVNFFVALIPASILSNWIFYKSARSIPAIIIFHFMLNLSSVIWQTEQFTKVIVTCILLLISVMVVFGSKHFFLTRR